MYVVDMHNDSLSEVSEGQGLLNSYNVSQEYAHLQFFAHYSSASGKSPEQRRRALVGAFDVYLYECERLRIKRILEGRDVFSSVELGGVSSIFSVEGGGGLFADSPELASLAGAGLSVLGMAWDSNELAAGANDECDFGLTDEGRKMAVRCSELGITLDVSHLSDRAFYELFRISPMPHIATHSNFREICPSKRNLTLEMAKMIASRGGVIGINLYPPYLAESGEAGIDDVMRHIDYGLTHLGEDFIAFGFDIDGTSGKYPFDIDAGRSIHDQVINRLLSEYSNYVVEKIAGLNVIDFLKNNLM